MKFINIVNFLASRKIQPVAMRVSESKTEFIQRAKFIADFVEKENSRIRVRDIELIKLNDTIRPKILEFLGSEFEIDEEDLDRDYIIIIVFIDRLQKDKK